MTAQELKAIVDELVKNLGLSISSEVTQDEELFLVNLTGKDVGLFEHARDNRAGALITIIKLIANQRHDVEPRLVIDFNNQRQQRLQNVAQMARKKAEMVRVSGEEEEMPPMPPAERRAVHVALKGMTGIKTESRGVEPHRRIVITASEEE